MKCDIACFRFVKANTLRALFISLAVLSIPTTVSGKDLVRQLIESHDLVSEVHEVITADGYKLTLHRLPPPELNATSSTSSPRNATGNSRARNPFLLMHGFLGSASDYVLTNRGHSLASQLHAQGYDVWLANARGTTYSKRHMDLDPTTAKYWNFSWHEIGALDLPAMIDYILAVTGKQQLHYVGHSQGTTVFFVLLSERPEYNERIMSATLLAPVAYAGHIPSPAVRLAIANTPQILALVNHLGLHELFPSTALNQLGGHLLCGEGAATQQLCKLATYWTVGFSDYEIFPEVFPRIFDTSPAGVSRKQLDHFRQLISSGKFQQYDYGSKEANYRRYERKTPPPYKLENVRVPLHFYCGTSDLLVAKKDVMRLSRELPKSTNLTMHELRGFNHVDLVWSKEAPRRVFKQILLDTQRMYS